MHESIDAVFTAGAIVGAVLVTTLLVVPLIRYIVLIAATCAIAAVYFRGGIPELIVYVNGVQAEIVSKPIFSGGILAGVLFVTLLRLGRPQRRISG
jgi:hypothetical protein